MTNDSLAQSHLRRARRILAEAEELCRTRDWDLAVRRCQEAVELALKGALRSVGAEVPKLHDVGRALRLNQDRFGDDIRSSLDQIVSVSRSLGRERGLAFYGDEDSGAGSEELYTEADAQHFLKGARFVVGLVAAHMA